ncbi:MAG TPA: epoxide hydrolase N-terminal domain-containing protein, partial [Burkholderiaceae bacterium]
MTPQPFTLHVSEADLADLRERLARTRYPDRAPGAPWAFGTDPDWLRGLVAHWREGFDWRAQEARLGAWPNFRVRMAAFGGVPLHFLHVSGRGPKPLPLLLAHGWPGSVFEFLD